ncbi:MAG: thiamine diphosphokinase, partial [Chloroflexi bacterium]|nr:thiamine diphosphokinase [Chloroflexota bacterium]
MRTLIFANGVLDHLPIEIQPDDFIIAADGGARHCLALGLIPAMVVGDFDSLTADELTSLEAAGAELIRHPARKDETDLELALLQAIELGASEVVILGALGARWDMTLANLLLLAHPNLRHPHIRVLAGHQEITLLRAGETVELRGQPGDTVSLIPLRGDARGITTEGLEYPLDRGGLKFGATRGISNVLLRQRASVTLEDGLLLCVVIHRI